jgi:hypothetical protein
MTDEHVIPEGYPLAGTKFSISEITVEDADDKSGDAVLVYDLYHEDDVDGNELSKIVSELIHDALLNTIRNETETKEDDTND